MTYHLVLLVPLGLEEEEVVLRHQVLVVQVVVEGVGEPSLEQGVGAEGALPRLLLMHQLLQHLSLR
jgi:hypothetical protein